jgi:hypothetical protein
MFRLYASDPKEQAHFVTVAKSTSTEKTGYQSSAVLPRKRRAIIAFGKNFDGDNKNKEKNIAEGVTCHSMHTSDSI